MKKSIFLFFAAILCAMSVSAAIPSKLYLDASDWGYSDARYAAYFMPQNSFVDMTKATGEVSVFEVAVPASQTKVIFVRMNGSKPANDWANKWNQTGDLTIPIDGKNKFKPSGWDGATTTWSTYTYTPPTFYIAGDFVTPNWSENAAANKMDYADGVFSKSYDNVAASAHQFKITNGTWNNAVGYSSSTCSGTNCTVENGGGNIKFTPLAEGTVTITYTLADGKVHITCPEPPAVEYNITYPATQTNYTLVTGPAKAQAGAEVSFTATPADGYVLNVTYNGNAITGNNNVYAFMMPAADVTIAIEAVAATTLYYVDHNSWGNANAYMWNDSGNNGWPGAAMALVGTVGDNAYSYYSISFAQGAYTSIIFNDGDDSQTADLTINTAKPYFYDGAWYTWDELLAKLAAPVVTYDYYLTGSLVGGWEPKQQGIEKDGELYKATFNALAAGTYEFKITAGDWEHQWNYNNLGAAYEEVSQGVDGEGNPNGNIKIVTEEIKNITVIFDATAGKITFEGLTEIEDYYTVVGTEALFGTPWDITSEANKMEKLGDGSYKLVKENVTLAAIEYEWKITKNGSDWMDDNTAVNPAGNNKLQITTAGRYNVTFTLAADIKSAKAEIELIEAAVVIPDCFISGNATLTGGEGWQGNEFTMVYDEESETWSYTLVGLATEKAYELKVVCGGTWYSYANLASIPTGVTEGNDHSIAFKMAEAGDVTVTYNVEAGITISGNFYVAPTYDYYIAGTENLTGFNWSANGLGMTKDGDVYKHTFNALAAGTYQFKITDGQWNTEEDKTHEYTILGAQYEEVSYFEGNIQIVTEEAKNITVIFDGSKITFEGLTEIVPTELVYNVTVPAGTPNCYIVFGDAWDAENAPAMDKVDDTHYTYTRTGLKSDEYKYLYGQSWDFVEVRADNRTWAEEDVVENWNNPYTEVRTALTAGNYYTICMTKEMKEVKGATLWSFCGKDANFAYLVQENAPYTAGKAYIMYAEAETVSAILTGEPAAAPVANGAIYGTFVDMDQDALDDAGDNIYLVIGNQLRRVDGQTGNSLPANRAYVDIDQITGGAPAGIPANRVRSMPMQPQVTTGVENVDASAQPVKTIINGQLFILRGEKMYDAQGKLVK